MKVDICGETGLFLSNTFFQHKMIHRYTWARGNERSLIDYIAVDNRLRREVEDTKVVRGMFSGSDHFAVVAKVGMRVRWEFKGKGKKGERRELASERLRNSEDNQRYGRKVEELLSRAREGMEESACVSEVFETFKRSLIQATEEVVGCKTCRRGKKGTAWWTQEIKIAVEEKRKAYKKMLQRNVTEEVRE